MRKAVVTLCIGSIAEEWAKFTHEPMKMYAEKVNADFIKIDKQKINYCDSKNFNPILFEKYQIYDILNDYDRVLYVDTDILITPQAPDIFNLVPEDKIGGVCEDFGMDTIDRRKLIGEVQKCLGDLHWKEGFLNSGVMVVSKIHRESFRYFKKYGCYDGKYEQTNTNWYFRKAGFEIIDLDHRFNYMGISRVFYGTEPHDAYFIHYAGGGIFNWIPKLKQVKADYEYFYDHQSEKDIGQI